MRVAGRVAAVGIGVSLLLQSGAAVGDVLRRADPVGDVWRTPIGSSSYAPAPTRVEGDIVSSRVSHGPHAIWIGIRLRELTTTSNGLFTRLAIVSDRRYRAIAIDALPGHWDGRAVTTTRAGLVVGCGVTHRIDYDENRIVVRVPRVCLGRHPAWVRVAIRTTVAGTTYAYTDDARTTGLVSRVVFGHRVRR
jgi:hypothetical protein